MKTAGSSFPQLFHPVKAGWDELCFIWRLCGGARLWEVASRYRKLIFATALLGAFVGLVIWCLAAPYYSRVLMEVQPDLFGGQGCQFFGP